MYVERDKTELLRFGRTNAGHLYYNKTIMCSFKYWVLCQLIKWFSKNLNSGFYDSERHQDLLISGHPNANSLR